MTLETVEPTQRFQEFFKRENYRQKIAQLAISGRGSLTIDFEELYGFDQTLSEMLLAKPEEYLQYAGKGAYEQLRIEDSEYAEKLDKIIVRVVKLLGREVLRKLGSRQMSKLVMVEGIVVRATPVRPMVQVAAFKCKRCGTMNHVDQNGQFLKAPSICMAPDCGRDGPFEFNQEESIFIDSQDLRLQEKPEDLPPGQLPRVLAVKLVGDEIVDLARPGDHVSVVGIVRAFAPSLMGMGKLRTFILQLDANSIEVLGKEPETSPPTPEEEEKILKLSRDPLVHKKIMSSIAPSIFGLDHVKEAIMYLLFGGVSKSLPDVNVRGEMNALLIGDPGTAKSQLLQYVSKIAPRGLYTSGRGTTAAGLTAAVVREKGGSMSLEAGALVLADKGIACIDEMDKMRPEDRVAIH
ncbi:MAG: minichromosome maintenance protein MCM, partial [Candidatus Bathyarchaeota archaeon]|nr:minichromosome maintenance protein MCM [Candidatus Bathyarchaeota archaeon]